MNRLIHAPLCWLEKAWQRGPLARMALCCAGMLAGWVALAFADWVWLAYAGVLALAVPKLADPARSWKSRGAWVALTAALIGFGAGRAMWWLWPDQFKAFAFIIEYAHFALLAHVVLLWARAEEMEREAGEN